MADWPAAGVIVGVGAGVAGAVAAGVMLADGVAAGEVLAGWIAVGAVLAVGAGLADEDAAGLGDCRVACMVTGTRAVCPGCGADD